MSRSFPTFGPPSAPKRLNLTVPAPLVGRVDAEVLHEGDRDAVRDHARRPDEHRPVPGRHHEGGVVEHVRQPPVEARHLRVAPQRQQEGHDLLLRDRPALADGQPRPCPPPCRRRASLSRVPLFYPGYQSLSRSGAGPARNVPPRNPTRPFVAPCSLSSAITAAIAAPPRCAPARAALCSRGRRDRPSSRREASMPRPLTALSS